MAERYDTPPEYPVRLHVQTISYCNAHCLFCAYPAVAGRISHGIMEDVIYTKIIDEAARYHPKRISLLLMNEPLLDRKLPERVRYAKDTLSAETEVTITSNGSLLTPRIISRLIDSGLDRIKISIQGITKDTYEQVMGLKYERTFKGINLLVDTLKERKASRPKVVLSMVNVGHNEDEIKKYKRYWRRKGIKATTVAFENKGGNIKEDIELHPFGLQAMERCYRFNRCAYILYNGDVIPCCADWARTVVLGNVKEKSLRDIWHGEKLNAIRDSLRAGNHALLPGICQSCKVTRLRRRSHRSLAGIYQKIAGYFQDQRRT